jgi:hypothetical protein
VDSDSKALFNGTNKASCPEIWTLLQELLHKGHHLGRHLVSPAWSPTSRQQTSKTAAIKCESSFIERWTRKAILSRGVADAISLDAHFTYHLILDLHEVSGI